MQTDGAQTGRRHRSPSGTLGKLASPRGDLKGTPFSADHHRGIVHDGAIFCTTYAQHSLEATRIWLWPTRKPRLLFATGNAGRKRTDCHAFLRSAERVHMYYNALHRTNSDGTERQVSTGACSDGEGRCWLESAAGE